MKILTMVLLFLAISLCIILPAQAAIPNSPSLSGIQIFPKDHIWNTRVDNLPVDAKSDIYITDLKKDTGIYPGLRHYIRNAIPYNLVNSTQRHQYLTSFHYAYYSDNVAYPIPNNPLMKRHVVTITWRLLMKMRWFSMNWEELTQALNGSWHAGTGAVWDLNGYSFRKNNETPMWSTTESGLPIFPGLVRYDEVSAGHIDHALAMNLPAMQNKWVWPARSASPIPGVTDPAHPPAGQRFRLKASYDISGFPLRRKLFFRLLKPMV